MPSSDHSAAIRKAVRFMVQERIYTAAAVLTSPHTAEKSGKFSDLSTNTSLAKMIARFLAHVEVKTK
jgi:hypothetical protein